MAPFLECGYAISDTEAHVVRWFNDEGVYIAVGSGEPGSKMVREPARSSIGPPALPQETMAWSTSPTPETAPSAS